MKNVTELLVDVGEIRPYTTETIDFQLVIKDGYKGKY